MAVLSASEANRFFDGEFYLNSNPDVDNAVEDGVFENPIDHFVAFGIDENRAPSQALTFFSEEDYLAENPDVQEAVDNGIFQSGTEHFLSYGVNELDVRGESTGYGFFDGENYLDENPDVATAVNDGILDSALEHYLKFGFSEGRSGLFSISDSAEDNVVSEGDTLTFTVESINGGNVGQDTPVEFSFAGDVDVDDITGDSLSGTATIPAGSNSTTFSVELAEDGNEEELETISASATVLGDESLESETVEIEDSTDGGNEVDLTGQTEVTASADVAETFVFEFTSDSTAEVATSEDTRVSISGFDPAEDILRFDDSSDPAISQEDFLNFATVASNGFAGETNISFLDPNPGNAADAGQVSLQGITDDTLGGSDPFFEVV